jgi:superoxide reductase
MKFYICKTCGNIITKVKDSSVPVVCCGKVMEELVAGSVDASKEKHVPVYNLDNNKVFVMVGEAEHPMTEEHYIEWIAIETNAGTQIKYLAPGEKPAASFNIGSQDNLISVYAYCNLHGLWKKEHEEPVVCDLKPLDMKTNENYVVCKCNSVKFFDIVDAAQNQKDFNGLLNVFENVKNTTHCSTGCGGCYNKVLAIISEVLSGNIR